MKLLIIFLICGLLLVGPALAIESINIASPADSTMFTDGETVPIYIQTSNSSMSAPFIQFSDNLGSWLPTNQINSNEYLKYWDTSTIENGSYIISVKTVLSGINYFDSVTVSVDNDLYENEDDAIDLDTLKVDGLSTSITYDQKDSLWIQVFDNETNIAISEPVLNIYNPNLKSAIMGTVNGLIKIEWVDLDNKELVTDKYLVSIRKDGYKSIDFLIDIENGGTNDESDDDEITTPIDKMAIWGMDRRIVVNGGSDIFITDSDGDWIEGVYLKILEKRTDTVLRTEITNEFGNVYMIWDIVGEYTIGITHPDYKPTSESVTVVNPTVVKTESNSATTASTQEPVIHYVDVPADVTRDDVEQFLEDELIDGKPYLEVLKAESIAEGIAEGKRLILDEQAQNDADKTIVDKLKDNAMYILGALGALVLLLGCMRYKSHPLFKEDVDKIFCGLKSKIIKNGDDAFDVDSTVDVDELKTLTRKEFFNPENMDTKRHTDSVPQEPDNIPSTDEHVCAICSWSGKTEAALKSHITREHKED